jgi:hypothetical protein
MLAHFGFDVPDVLGDRIAVVAPDDRRELTLWGLFEEVGQLGVRLQGLWPRNVSRVVRDAAGKASAAGPCKLAGTLVFQDALRLCDFDTAPLSCCGGA